MRSRKNVIFYYSDYPRIARIIANWNKFFTTKNLGKNILTRSPDWIGATTGTFWTGWTGYGPASSGQWMASRHIIQTEKNRRQH
jgi:hypothetical protein